MARYREIIADKRKHIQRLERKLNAFTCLSMKQYYSQ